MFKILTPVDGSEYAVRAVQEAIRIAKHFPGGEVFALNVQIPIVSGHARMFLDKVDIQNYYDTESEQALASVKTLLEQSGLTFHLETRVGSTGETIAKFAKENNCDHIIMGTRGLGSVAGMILGSVATKVIHLSSVPVTLIK